jgi:hypothetical protein
LIVAALIASRRDGALIAREWEDTMKSIELVTALACLLALAGCPTSEWPIADSTRDGGGGGGRTSHEGPGDDTVVAGRAVGPCPQSEHTVGTCPPEPGDLEGPVAGRGVPVPGTNTGNQRDSGVGSADPGTGTPTAGGEHLDSGTGGASDSQVGSAGTGHLDAGTAAPPAPQLQTLSRGCEPIAGAALCFGEGWMLAAGEAAPACGESGAYRICTFADGGCVSHTVMMVQRCD